MYYTRLRYKSILQVKNVKNKGYMTTFGPICDVTISRKYWKILEIEKKLKEKCELNSIWTFNLGVLYKIEI